jgi:hypothetical protein
MLQVCLVSHQEQPTGQPCNLTKIAGTPVKLPSPWMVSNTSLTLYNKPLVPYMQAGDLTAMFKYNARPV